MNEYITIANFKVLNPDFIGPIRQWDMIQQRWAEEAAELICRTIN